MAVTIKGSLGLTKKIKDFDFFRIDAGVERTIADGADETKAWEDLWNEVEAQINKKIAEEFDE